MIELQAKEKIQQSEASPQCLVSNVTYSGNAMQVIPEDKNGDSTYVGEKIGVDNLMIWEPYAYPYHGYNGPYFIQETSPLPFPQPNFHVFQPSQMSIFHNNIYPMNQSCSFPLENQFYYMPSCKMFPQACPSEVQAQEFQYFVVIDFEATCDKVKIPEPQEIIEFPSVLVNGRTGQLEASFQTYVCPAYHRHLTDFCKELTGIQQIQVDRGVPLTEAILMHDKWLEEKGIKHKNFAVVTWSNWDCRVMLDSECRLKRIRKPPYFNRWINLRVPFQEKFGDVRCNLKEAVELAGLTWEGRQHSGLDDANNTARLLVHLMRQGIKFSITNSMSKQLPDSMKTRPFRDFVLDQNRQPHKLKGPAAVHPIFYHAPANPAVQVKYNYCYCGVLSSKGVIRKPGPNQGKCFYGCGNWTATRRAACNYFVWDSP